MPINATWTAALTGGFAEADKSMTFNRVTYCANGVVTPAFSASVVAGRHEPLLDLPKFGSHPLGYRLPSEHVAAAIPPGRAIMLEP